MHLLTIGFDDGFQKSVLEIAQAYETHGLKACFNVIATAHHADFVAPDEFQAGIPRGDFGLWRELRARGHEIMPHGYRHANKAELPFDEARNLILRCLDVFDSELPGFDRCSAVFNFPYNRTTPQIEQWLPTVVRGFRGGLNGTGLNPLPSPQLVALRSTGFGPDNCEAHLDRCVDGLLAQPSGWLVYCCHGIDEGWGPIRIGYLRRLLERLKSMPTVRIAPTAEAFSIGNGSRAS